MLDSAALHITLREAVRTAVAERWPGYKAIFTSDIDGAAHDSEAFFVHPDEDRPWIENRPWSTIHVPAAALTYDEDERLIELEVDAALSNMQSYFDECYSHAR